MFFVAQTLKSLFPDLLDRLGQIEDPRLKDSPLKKLIYPIEAILCASIAMYLFREGSRHAMNAATSFAFAASG